MADSSMSLEKSLSELEAIVKQLESGQLDIDKAIEAYAKGMALSKSCRAKLEAMTAKVNAISASETAGELSDNAGSEQ